MEVLIAIKFDKREVGQMLDLSGSTAKRLLDKGIVAIEPIVAIELIVEKKVNNKTKTKK